jgi:hypothetical protein
MENEVMNQNTMNEYITEQIHIIDEAKWLEGCRTNKDPGNEFVAQWVQTNAAEFRKIWNS